MSKSFAEIQQSLAQLGILSPQELAEILRAAGKDEKFNDPKELAKLLVAAGKLTRFQATAIWEGAAASLQFGDYIILDKIGAGGMGHVYKAQHRRMKRILAIKMLHKSSVTSDATIKRFFREVESAAKLNHPNIVTAYDAGEHRGEYYLAMEFVDGKDLTGVLKERGPLPIDHAVNIILQACTGLAYAHDQGMVHRDIKPANLLLARDGTVKILDMGLARSTLEDESAAASDQSLTMAGKLLGTVEYMSPEQAANPKLAGPQADIYALGCTLYRLLTGNLPYRGSTSMETVMAHQSQPIPQLSESMSGSPLELLGLQQVLEGMMAKKVEDRFQTVNQVVSELTNVVPNAARAKLVMSAPVEDSFSLTGAATPSTASKSSNQPSQVSRSGYKAKAAPPEKKTNPLIYAGLAVAVIAIVCGVIFRPDAKPAAPTSAPIAQNTPVTPEPAAAPMPLVPAESPAASEVAPAAAAKDSQEILPLMDVKRDTAAGNWEITGSPMQLAATGDSSRIFLPMNVPASYRLEFTMSGPPANGGVAIGLVGQGRQFRVVLEGAYKEKRITALGNIKGNEPPDTDTATESFQIEQGKDYKVACIVKSGQVQIEIDGKRLIDWQGSMADLSLPSLYANVNNTGSFFLSVATKGWVFKDMKLASLDGSPVTASTQPAQRPSVASSIKTLSPSTGAIDALPLIRLDQHVLAGNWRSESGAIIAKAEGGNGNKDPRLVIPVLTPASYRMEAQVTRLGGDNVFWMRLPHSTGGFAVGFDNFGSRHLTGPDMINGKRLTDLPDNGNVHKSFQFVNGKSQTLACTVQPGLLIVEIDGKEVYRFQGDLRTLGGTVTWMNSGDRRLPAIGCYNSEFRVDKLSLISLEKSSTEFVEGKPVDLMPLAAFNPDGSTGWRMENGSLLGKSSDKGSCFVHIRQSCPESYRVEFRATRLSGGNALGLRLPRRARDFVLMFDFGSEHLTGPFAINGVEAKNLKGLYNNFKFASGQSNHFACTVMPGSLSIRIDGKEVYLYQGDMDALGGNPGWLKTGPLLVPMFIGMNPSEYRLENVTLIPLMEKAAVQLVDGQTIDLLKQIDPNRDSPNQSWKSESGALVSDPKSIASNRALLKLPITPPSQFRLDMEIATVTEGSKSLDLRIPFANTSLQATFDGYHPNHLSGLSALNGKNVDKPENPTRSTALRFDPGKPVNLSLTVADKTISASADGKPLFSWTGDNSQIDPGFFKSQVFNVYPASDLLITGMGCSYRITRLTLTPLIPAPEAPGPEKQQIVMLPDTTKSVKVMPLLEAVRDTAAGDWEIKDGIAFSPNKGGNSVLQLPVDVPAAYQLTARVHKLTDAANPACLGLVAGDRQCMMVLCGAGTQLISGLSQINGQSQDKNETASSELKMVKGGSYLVTCAVEPGRITADVDGKRLVDWHGDFSSLSVNSGWKPADPKRLFLASTAASRQYAYSDITLSPLAPHTELKNQLMPVISDLPWTPLLPLVDPAQDATGGKWQRVAENLQGEGAKANRLALPVSPRGSYELRLKFKRLSGAMLGVHLPVGDQSLLLSLGQIIGGAPVIGLGNIEGKSAITSGNPTRVELPPIDNNSEHTLGVQVISKESEIRVAVIYDDQLVIDWTGSPGAISTFKDFAPADPARPGLFSNGSKVLFSDVQFRMLQGEANLMDRAVASSSAAIKKPVPENARIMMAMPGPAPKIAKIQRNQRVDLTKASILPKDGKWQPASGLIAADGRGLNDPTWARIPLRPTGSYEISFTFQNKDPESEVRILLPLGPKGCALWVFTPTGSGFVDMSGRDWKQNRLTTYVNLQSGNAAVYKFRVDIGTPIITVNGEFIRDNTRFTPAYTFSAEELIPYSDDTTMALGVKGGRVTVRDFRIQLLGVE